MARIPGIGSQMVNKGRININKRDVFQLYVCQNDEKVA